MAQNPPVFAGQPYDPPDNQRDQVLAHATEVRPPDGAWIGPAIGEGMALIAFLCLAFWWIGRAAR